MHADVQYFVGVTSFALCAQATEGCSNPFARATPNHTQAEMSQADAAKAASAIASFQQAQQAHQAGPARSVIPNYIKAQTQQPQQLQQPQQQAQQQQQQQQQQQMSFPYMVNPAQLAFLNSASMMPGSYFSGVFPQAQAFAGLDPSAAAAAAHAAAVAAAAANTGSGGFPQHLELGKYGSQHAAPGAIKGSANSDASAPPAAQQRSKTRKTVGRTIGQGKKAPKAAKSSSSRKRKKKGAATDRRNYHRLAEQKRRTKISELVSRLHHLLPNHESIPLQKPTVFATAIDHINNLTDRVESQTARINALEEQLAHVTAAAVAVRSGMDNDVRGSASTDSDLGVAEPPVAPAPVVIHTPALDAVADAAVAAAAAMDAAPTTGLSP